MYTRNLKFCFIILKKILIITCTNWRIHSFPCSLKNVCKVSIPWADNNRYPLLLLLFMLFREKNIALVGGRLLFTLWFTRSPISNTCWSLVSPNIYGTLIQSFYFKSHCYHGHIVDLILLYDIHSYILYSCYLRLEKIKNRKHDLLNLPP